MLRRIGWYFGWNYRTWSTRRLPDAKPRLAKVKPVAMFDTVNEIAIYIHRFHNLDLFQQGWYQIKITMRWEDTELTSVGTPARVVQYEAHDLGSDDMHGVWIIDDTDNSFSTQPFRIKYARQDVLLSMMVAFNMSLGNREGPPKSAVILKFELMYAPTLETGLDTQASLNSVAVHEFRVPPKALLGLHSYCPVHFDAFHAVLVDISVHISLLKAGFYAVPSKVPSESYTVEVVEDRGSDGSNQTSGPMTSSIENGAMLVKSLLSARDSLIEELQRLSKSIDRALDLTDFISNMDDINLFDSLDATVGATNGEVSGQDKPLSGLKSLYSLPRSAQLNYFHLLGDQVSYLWNMFLHFHRSNKTKLVEYLCDAWAKDRRAEWSIWMVCSKIEMPHHFLNSGNDESSHGAVHRRGMSLRKLKDEPAHAAAMRAELHRQSILQMKINSRSIQDMHIFGDPSLVPVIIVERILNAPRRTTSVNSYLTNLDMINSPKDAKTLSGSGGSKNSRVLKIVVFVHGFQGYESIKKFVFRTLPIYLVILYFSVPENVIHGHHLDLRLVRNQWLLLDPKIEFLMSEANEDKTSGDFRDMGQRLAQEVVSFIKRKMDKASRRGGLADFKLSFVGHSIGNVIIRTALAESIMDPFRKYLYTYVSISGPHLGYLYSSNSLFNSGLWVLKKFKSTQCIHQLTFTDDPDLRNTFFYKICKKKTLDNFKHIILLSSPQDGYVPYHSARIDMCQAASCDYSKKGQVFLEMLNDCLDQIRAASSTQRVFLRCDVNFNTAAYGKNLNSFIGRAAHIEFLESDIFARFLLWSFPELFL